MNNDRAIGAAIFLGSVIDIVVYPWLVISFAIMPLQITAFLPVGTMLVITAWINSTMATTPPAAPLKPEPISTQTGASSSSDKKPSSAKPYDGAISSTVISPASWG